MESPSIPTLNCSCALALIPFLMACAASIKDKRTIVISVDGSEHSERAFDCEYIDRIPNKLKQRCY